MSLENKAKELAEKAKIAANNAAEKAKVAADDVSLKVKEIDVDKIKNDVTGDDGKVSVESISALTVKTKAIVGGVLLLIIIMFFSSGGRSYSVSNFSEPFPSDGSLEERCDKVVFLQYDYFNLVNDGVDSDELITALDIAINTATADKESFKTLPQMEQKYYRALYELKRSVSRSEGRPQKAIKEKFLAIDTYEEAVDKCVAREGAGGM